MEETLSHIAYMMGVSSMETNLNSASHRLARMSLEMLGNETTTTSTTVAPRHHAPQPLLWVLLCVVFAAMGALYFFAFKRDWFTWEHVTPRSLTGHISSSRKAPMILFCTRLFSFVFSLIIIITIFATSASGQGLQFYTIWNFILLVVYFGCVSIKSFFALRNGSFDDNVPNPSVFDKSTVVIFHIVFTMVFLVDIVLWTILYPTAKHQHAKHPNDPDYDCCEKFTNFFSVTVHGLNLVMVLIEVLQNRMRMTKWGFLWVATWMFAYGIFQWLYAAAGGPWVYFFMDTTIPAASGWYVGMLVLHTVFFFIAFAIGKVKEIKFNLKGDADAESSYLLNRNTSVA